MLHNFTCHNLSPLAPCQQAAILQFIGGELPPSGRATDGLRQWQRTALTQLGLIQAPAAATSGVTGTDGAAAVDNVQQQQAQQQPQQLVDVSIGGQPPVSGALLAAVRVVLAQVRVCVEYVCEDGGSEGADTTCGGSAE